MDGAPSFPMRTGFDPLASPVSVEKRAMMLCIHNFLVTEGTAVYRLYRWMRYDLLGKEVDETTELELLRKAMRYIVLSGVGGELEQVLYAVIHDTPVQNETLLEKYSGLIRYYPQVFAKMTAGEPTMTIVEWLTRQTNDVDVSDDDDDSNDEDEHEHESIDDILLGVDQADEHWSHFVPTTPIQTIVKDALDKM